MCCKQKSMHFYSVKALWCLLRFKWFHYCHLSPCCSLQLPLGVITIHSQLLRLSWGIVTVSTATPRRANSFIGFYCTGTTSLHPKSLLNLNFVSIKDSYVFVLPIFMCLFFTKYTAKGINNKSAKTKRDKTLVPYSNLPLERRNCANNFREAHEDLLFH